MASKKTSADDFKPRDGVKGTAFNMDAITLPAKTPTVTEAKQQSESKAVNAPDELCMEIMGMASLFDVFTYEKSPSLNYCVYTSQGKQYKILHLRHTPTRSNGFYFFEKTDKMPEALIYNQELTLEEYNWLTQVFVRKSAEYIVDHISEFYPEKVNNDRWNKKTREDQVEDILELYTSPFNRELRKEAKEELKKGTRTKDDLTDKDYYAPSWKIKVVLNKDTNMPECNVYIQESGQSIRPLYAHPQPPLPFQTNHDDETIRSKYIQDYQDALIPFKADNARQGWTKETLDKIIPKYCEAAPAWDYLGISVTQGKWTHSTRYRQGLITKMPETREYHVPGGIAPCLFQGFQLTQALPNNETPSLSDPQDGDDVNVETTNSNGDKVEGSPQKRKAEDDDQEQPDNKKQKST